MVLLYFHIFVLWYFVIWLDSPYEFPCKIWILQLKKLLSYEYFCMFLYFCILFGLSIRTSMHNLNSIAQEMSELCSFQHLAPFRACVQPTYRAARFVPADNTFYFLVWLCCQYYSDPCGSNWRHSPAPYMNNTATFLNTGQQGQWHSNQK